MDSQFLGAGDESLQNYQYDGINYLYDLEPQQLNLFKVAKFYDPAANTVNESNKDSGYENPNAEIPDKLAFRIKAISGIKLPAFTIADKDFKSAFKLNLVTTGRQEKNTVSIDWFEDAYLTTRRYHMNWMNHWYNRYLDCMVCGQYGKFRNMVAYMFHYINTNSSSAAPVLTATPIAKFEWMGLIPDSAGEDLKLDASTTGNEETVKITYHYNALNITFYPYENGDADYIGGMAKEVQAYLGTTSNDGEIDFGKVLNTGILGDTNWHTQDTQYFSGVDEKTHKSTYII